MPIDMRPKILFATSIIQYPPIGGPRLRIHNCLAALSQVADLLIYCRTSPARVGGEAAVNYYRKFAKLGFYFASSSGGSLWQDFRELNKLAKKHGIKTIWLGYGNISYGLAFLLKLFTPSRVVIDTDSVWSRFVLRGLPYQTTWRGKLRTWYLGYKKRLQEILGTAAADLTTAVSEFDARYYRKISRRKVAVFSNVIDLGSYEQRAEAIAIQKPAVYFAGSFGPESSMEQAAVWLIKKIMPLIWKQRPEILVYLVGRGDTSELSKFRNDKVIITGQVPSAVAYLKQADVAVVPLKFESGTRFKILEAAACRIPIVSTTLGAEGLMVRPGEDILIADTPGDFAGAILKLLARPELRQRISANAYENIAKNYNIDRAVKEATLILKMLNLTP